MHRPEIELPGGSFAVGDRVAVRRNDRPSDLNNGDRGIVPAIERDVLELECSGRRVRLKSDFLLARTTHGDPTLMHGYAVTVHVAQGITVDRAHVLGHGLTRESGYTAMSRGREANHLYVAEEVPAREEFAPADLTRPTAVERLVNDLQRSDAQSLGIDTGASDLAQQRERLVAESAAAAARARRIDVERSPWRPGRRHRVEAAQREERLASARAAELREADKLSRPAVPREPVARRPRPTRTVDRDFGIDR